MNNIHDLDRRILTEATDEERESLLIDKNYGSPQSFYQSALHRNLINESEYERARLWYGNLWYYRGD